MLHHSISDVRILARAYLKATGIGAYTLSLAIAQNDKPYSNKLIPRLLNNKSCHAETLELASNWFRANWPDGVPWPLDAEEREEMK